MNYSWHFTRNDGNQKTMGWQSPQDRKALVSDGKTNLQEGQKRTGNGNMWVNIKDYLYFSANFFKWQLLLQQLQVGCGHKMYIDLKYINAADQMMSVGNGVILLHTSYILCKVL